MTCDKATYETHKDAMNQIVAISKFSRQKKRDMLAYKCEHCGKFHLATRGKKTLWNPRKQDKYPIKIEEVKKAKKKEFTSKGTMPISKSIPLATEKLLSGAKYSELKNKRNEK